MARKAEATFWILVGIGERSVMKRMLKKGRSYVPNVEGPYEPGSYYLRYTQNGKRTWEAVGSDLTIALQEKKARQKALETPAVPVTVTALPKRNLREAVAGFLNGKDNKNGCHILTVFGDWWGWEKHVADFQRPDFKAFAKHVASLPLRPRTQDNYLRSVCTFFRAAGRVVEIVQTGCREQLNQAVSTESQQRRAVRKRSRHKRNDRFRSHPNEGDDLKLEDSPRDVGKRRGCGYGHDTQYIG